MEYISLILTLIVLIVNITSFIVIKFNDLKHLSKAMEEMKREIKSEIKCLRDTQVKHEGEINYLKGKLNGK